MVLIAVIIVARFVLEAAQVPKNFTSFVSASVVGSLIVIYLGAVAPLWGISRAGQLAVPALVWSAWSGGLDTLALIVSAVLRLPGSHFADAPGILHNWQHVGTHVASHLALIPVGFLVNFGLMAMLFSLHRWPVIVAPSAVLGGLVVLRFTAEAMHFAPTTAAAWSSTVGILLSSIYLGGMGPRMGLVSARQLLAPALVLGWVWRFWVFLAVLATAPGLYKTHFFDPSQGRVALRLLQFLGREVIVVGALAGLLVWGIAVWTLHLLRPVRAA